MDENVRRTVAESRFLNRLFVLAIGFQVLVLMVLDLAGFEYPLAQNRIALAVATSALAIAAIGNLAFAPLVFRRALREACHEDNAPRDSPETRDKGEANAAELLRTAWLTRGVVYEAIALYGLILGVQGTPWYVVLPFFAVSAVALVLTTPTEREAKHVLPSSANLESRGVLVWR